MKKHVLVLIFAFLMLTACSSQQTQGTPISSFSFMNQHSQEFGMEQLEGKVWIADFIFTNCETVCPPMTAKMAELQQEIKEKEYDVEFVSFSVDPGNDTPEKLNEYLTHFTNNDDHWNVLTGYTQDEIEKFALEEFQTLVHKPDSTDQVLHGVNFYVINSDGVIVNEFGFTEPDLTESILKEIEKQ
ncbi:SCO family protein [Jeotgalibacillus soli]|uniref:Thioredoxin domain-containing protein n=1 Tax=Jeotgalibacillus soli TaxID=889306 RepID=A0A0C2RY78_9BACL|nr:SCO family protein [Jeotgalibacillus soli]KIL46744.1 hypothetical protein KP78_18620 [Jeotgalibacillus soli]